METAPIRDESQFCAELRRGTDSAGLYRIWLDGPLLRIEAGGVWDIAAAKAYVTDITRIITGLRTLRPCLRVIVDRSVMPVFGAGVQELLLATYGNILRAGDRVAMIVDSSLTKGQLRQVAGREETQMFLSVSAARTWALAYDAVS